MCGIVGFFTKHNNFDNNLINLMVKTLIHRGPDNIGYYQDLNNSLFFGHTRLNIIDLNISGNQPLASSSGRYVIIFNGEIYNYKVIRNNLNKKFDIKWKGTSDTEVLLNSIEFFGIIPTLNNISGMFSFSLYDKKKSKLYLVRDLYGEKPLYYGYVNKKFYFASELKAITIDPLFKKKINKKSLNYLMTLNYIPSPLSIYENIFKLKPSHYIEIDLQNHRFAKDEIRQINYAKKEEIVPNNSLDFSTSKKKLKELIYASIEEQMNADVDVGCLLSSGIDSSLITSIMSKISKKKINTFSFGYQESYYDESKFSSKIANFLGTNHTNIIFDSKKALEIVPNLSQIFCEPFSDSSQVPTYLLTKEVSNHTKVVLCGDGGDELFGGYNRYIHAEKIKKVFERDYSFTRLFLYIISRFNNNFFEKFIRNSEFLFPAKYKINNIINKTQSILNSLSANSLYEFYFKLISHWEFNELIQFASFNNDIYRTYWKEENNFTQTIMNYDFKTYLPDDLLVKTDRTSMANSLEVRSPFLNNKIVNFSNNMPLEYKVNNSKGKIILKSILEDNLPKNLIFSKKEDFFYH